MGGIALLSDPAAGGRRLAELRSACARRGDIFHYELGTLGEVDRALGQFARMRPRIVAINGDDATAGAVMTVLMRDRLFGDAPPPLALLGGTGALLSARIGAPACPIAGLDRARGLHGEALGRRVVMRRPLAIEQGGDMRLGVSAQLRSEAAVELEADDGRRLSGRFALLLVTALGASAGGALTLVAVRRGWRAAMRGLVSGMAGRLGGAGGESVHRSRCAGMSIAGAAAAGLRLDGRPVEARDGPLRLRTGPPVAFLRL